MSRVGVVWIVTAVLVMPVIAQQAKPAFDVTSVKRSNARSDAPATYHFPPGRFVTNNLTLRLLIAALYSEDTRLADRLEGGPAWIDTDAYDIEGKVLEESPSTETLKAMARALLEDRFQLRVRREIRQGPVYELFAPDADGKFGPRLTPSSGQDCTTDPRASVRNTLPLCGLGLPITATEVGVSGYHLTMDEIALHLRTIVGISVINRTTLPGKFSFVVTLLRQQELSADVPGAASNPGGWRALVPSAVREQLGLRLVAATGPVEVLVIDSIQRPSEN